MLLTDTLHIVCFHVKLTATRLKSVLGPPSLSSHVLTKSVQTLCQLWSKMPTAFLRGGWIAAHILSAKTSTIAAIAGFLFVTDR